MRHVQSPIIRLLVTLWLACLGALITAKAIAQEDPPVRTVMIEVRDSRQLPVPDAKVEVLGRTHAIAVAHTDVHGQAVLRVPRTARIQSIIALKSRIGLDYIPAVAGGASAEDLEESYTLVLNGARTIDIRAVDSTGDTVEGARFVPWIISRPDRTQTLNLSASFIAAVESNVDGVATFDWIPADCEWDPGASFITQGSRYYWPNPHEGLYAQGGDQYVTAGLVRLTTISGTIVDSEMRPLEDILITAEGRSVSSHPFVAHTRTRLDGSYTLHVAPNQTYAIALDDEAWAGMRFAIDTREHEPVTGADLTAVRGVRIHGRMTWPDGTPVAGEMVILGMEQDPQDRLETATRGYWAGFAGIVIQRIVLTDEDGQWAFRIAPGSYRFCAIAAQPGDIHAPDGITIASDQRDDVEISLVKPEGTRILATSAAPYRVMSGRVFEYAMLPAILDAMHGDRDACVQCHRPVQSAGASK